MKGNKDIPIVFRPGNSGLEKFWGKLESQLMEIIWSRGPLTVKRAQYFLNKNHNYAYTTVMTVMNRLSDKSILSRKKKGHSFVYSPTMEKEGFVGQAVDKIISSLLDDYSEITSKAIRRLRKSSPRGR
jgi:predicted transcriptional regulator